MKAMQSIIQKQSSFWIDKKESNTIRLIVIAAISVSLIACGHFGSSYNKIPNVINVVSVDAQGRAIFTPLKTTPHVWGSTESLCTLKPCAGN